MTPEQKEAHKTDKEAARATARSKFPVHEQEIHEFIRARWAALGDAYDPDKHDKPVLQEAAFHFGITADQAKNIFIKIDGAGLDLR